MKRFLLTILLAVGFVVSAPLKPIAHESPVDHVDRGIRIWINGETIHVRYQLQLSERAAMMQLTQIDRNGDGIIADGERDEYFTNFADVLSKQLHLKIGNKELPLKRDAKVQFLPQFRQVYSFSAPCGPLASGKHSGVFNDEYSRIYPGAYRWDGPKIETGAGPRVVVANAPKAVDGAGHGGALQLLFDVLIP